MIMGNKTKHTADSKYENTEYCNENRQSVFSQKEIQNLLHALEADDSASSSSVEDGDDTDDEDNLCKALESIGPCILSEKEIQNLLRALKDEEE